MTTTLNDIHHYESEWRSILENKGYHSTTFEIKYEPQLDEVRINMRFYNTEWAVTYIDNDMSKCSRFELGNVLKIIDRWVRAQPREEEAREAKLLEDFARIKERIDASQLHDLIKAEVAALMDKMTTNILEDRRVVALHHEREDGIGEGQPNDA